MWGVRRTASGSNMGPVNPLRPAHRVPPNPQSQMMQGVSDTRARADARSGHRPECKAEGSRWF